MAKERTVTIELDYPVQLPDGELKRLVMHRPSVKEVMDNPIRDALDIAGESRLYAVLCGIGVEDIQALDMEDYGKHPIFGELNRLAELRQLPLPELFRRRENLAKDIWRLRKQVTERLQPHLLPAREARLAARQRELNAIDKMLAGYGTIQHN